MTLRGFRGLRKILDELGKLSLFTAAPSFFFTSPQLMQIKVLCNFNELLPPSAAFSLYFSPGKLGKEKVSSHTHASLGICNKNY